MLCIYHVLLATEKGSERWTQASMHIMRSISVCVFLQLSVVKHIGVLTRLVVSNHFVGVLTRLVVSIISLCWCLCYTLFIATTVLMRSPRQCSWRKVLWSYVASAGHYTSKCYKGFLRHGQIVGALLQGELLGWRRNNTASVEFLLLWDANNNIWANMLLLGSRAGGDEDIRPSARVPWDCRNIRNQTELSMAHVS